MTKLVPALDGITNKVAEILELAEQHVGSTEIVMFIHYKTNDGCTVEMVSTTGPKGIDHILKTVSQREPVEAELVPPGTTIQ